METPSITIEVPTALDMRALGTALANKVQGGDVLLLSGPLGAGKTTFAQGFGTGLGISEPIVSPTFTIARELNGTFANGTPAHLIHVDAYRLGGNSYAPGQNSVGLLLDELESLGLDEELDNPGESTVILMEWGEQMASALADERLEIHIDRPLTRSSDTISKDNPNTATPYTDADSTVSEPQSTCATLTSDGTRTVTLVPVGARWQGFTLNEA